jgi:hypothetical protein
MCVYVCMQVCVYVQAKAHLILAVYDVCFVCMCVYICHTLTTCLMHMHNVLNAVIIFTHTYMPANIHMIYSSGEHAHIEMYIYIYIYMYVYMCMYMHIYINI